MPLHKTGSPILANTLIWKFQSKASISNEIDMLSNVAMKEINNNIFLDVWEPPAMLLSLQTSVATVR
ncbi:hypothetical protein K443DRAFT_4259 [Laccaria amethystina LaAM-08-1]|uniref:Uncharacterized protein n=1 Tax=Laccaria amethystina LaAM-08-1 TaxID=1095629 RepID=A0A0C9WYL8_9AGAR|nr:hypothetical protein K443DRAFT_4259 [Laccaria amethystina LaAM-08-1]